MKIEEFLSPDSVIASLTAMDGRGVLLELSGRLAAAQPSLSQPAILQVLQERERLGSTGIGQGIAIPHGKLPGLQGLVGCFARSLPGVPFGALDGRPTHLFFSLLAPENAAGIHLRALAQISRLLRSEELRDALLAAPDAEAIYRLLVGREVG